MRIEVTYIDDSELVKRSRLHLPKLRVPSLHKFKPELHVPKLHKLKVSKPHKLKVSKSRFSLPRPVRNVLISAVVLVVVLVGGGVIYTYFMGQSVPEDATTVASAPAATQVKAITPSRPAANAPESAAVEMLTSPVAPGSSASMAVHTNAGSICEIAVIYNYDYMKKQTPVADAALGKKTADDFGAVDWAWTVAPATRPGMGKVTVTCNYNGRTAMVQGDLEVAK